jgi:hypothetical protein
MTFTFEVTFIHQPGDIDTLDQPGASSIKPKKEVPLMSAGLHPIIMRDLACSRVAEEHRRAERKHNGHLITHRARRAR